ncbi:protein SRC2-like [Oryza brachyantha]|uniref:protein SRC2-like n=1 Tax=Oryza brachyantha TaxID=4533 RepID=UPI001ADA3597|nr:protein SRC2-like [Oryza brachyantha]
MKSYQCWEGTVTETGSHTFLYRVVSVRPAPLEVTLISARNLKKVNLITPMEVYAVISVSGNPLTRQCTLPDRYGGRHPAWNATLHLAVPASAVSGAFLHVLLRTERALGDRDVGEVYVPLADLLATAAAAAGDDVRGLLHPPQLAPCQYEVRKVKSTDPCGMLSLSCRLGPVVAPAAADTAVAAAAPAYLVVPCYANAPPYVCLSPANPALRDAVSPPRRKKGGFGQWFGGAVGEMLTGGEMMSSDTAAYEAGVADGRIVKF